MTRVPLMTRGSTALFLGRLGLVRSIRDWLRNPAIIHSSSSHFVKWIQQLSLWVCGEAWIRRFKETFAGIFGTVVEAPDCRDLVCSSVHVSEKQSLGKAESLWKAPNFSSGSREKGHRKTWVWPDDFFRVPCKSVVYDNVWEMQHSGSVSVWLCSSTAHSSWTRN